MPVARAEFGRILGRSDPRLVGLALLGAAVLAVLLVLWAPAPPDPDAGIYRVRADDVPAAAALELDDRFRRVDDGPIDLWVRADGAQAAPTGRGQAALAAFQEALRVWQDQRLAAEDDPAAAFPIDVTLAFEPRQVPPGTTPPRPQPAPNPGPPEPGAPPEPSVLETAPPRGEVQEGLRPDDVDPPFPIRSLLLTFAIVVPASLIAQVHASTLHAERTRHRGVLLLSAPVSSAAFVLGKSAPAAVAMTITAVAVTVLLGAGWLGLLASLVIVGFLLALTSFLALISRTPRELSLLQVASTTMLNVFLFLPAMFPSIPPVAFLSPVHVIAASIRGDAMSLGQVLYATAPLSLAAFSLMALAIGLARDEWMFGVGPTMRRVQGALGAVMRTRTRRFAAGALVVPFVFAAQILVLVLVSVLGLRVAFLLWLPLGVVLEEAAKALVVWAGPRDRPWRSGLLAGGGFFLAEKGALVLTLVGFRDLPFGDEALRVLGTGPGALLLILPLALHVATATLLATGRGRWAPWTFLGAAGGHLLYNQILLGGVA